MHKDEIVVGGRYIAKVNNKLTTVVVTGIHVYDYGGSMRKERSYSVKNLLTGRETSFRSAAKFRSVAGLPPPVKVAKPKKQEIFIVE